MSERLTISLEATAIPPMLDHWLDDGLPLDIVLHRTTKREMEQRGCRMVDFIIYGETKADVVAKKDALGKLVEHHALKAIAAIQGQKKG